MALLLSPEEAILWDKYIRPKEKRSNKWASASETRKAKAIKLYLKTRSKCYVCDKLHMGRNTLNDILRNARVV